jgi:cellulose synthase/poly-beta-1,6-N-acetylglucosamine synthase-like glycosyltransferase
MEMNKKLCQGHKVVQGYLDSKNPNDSWIAGNYSIAFWIINRLLQLPRHYLGLSCVLGGTGFVVRTEILKEIGWGATSLTEDLEFSIKLVLKGMRVAWAHDAIVYDEKPLTLKQSWGQRKRWMQGHSFCAVKYMKDLLIKAFKERNIRAFDIALYLIQPFVFVANGVVLFFGMFSIPGNIHLAEILSVGGLIVAFKLILVTYYNVVFIYMEKKMSPRIFKYFLAFPIYSITWLPIIVQGFIDRNKREWSHTSHTRAIDINDLEKVEVEKIG